MSYKALGIIDAIRARPGMYIGDTESPDQLLTEIVDNMLDELANGYATNCSVEIRNETNECFVSDNGRGLEVYEMELPDGSKEDSIVALCSVAHTGSKFDTDDYDQLIGMHGVGLVAVNALSNWLRILTRDRKNRSIVHDYLFKESELEYKKQLNIEDNGNWSTIIQFKPNSEHFETNQFDIQQFANRMILAQAKYNNSILWFNQKQVPKLSFYDYVKKCLGLKKDESLYKLSYSADKNKTIEVYINYTSDSECVVKSDVNLRNCTGTFETNFQTALKHCILEKLDKKLKDVPQNLLTLGLKAYITISVPEPKFSSQSKNHMTLNVKDSLISPLQTQINWFVSRDGILETIQKNIESRLQKKIVKSTGKKRISNDNKLRDCQKIPGENLYIVEGDSALGALKQVRDPQKDAIFPLKGKIINVEKNSIAKIKENKEVSDLLEALGPKDNRRYQNIKILTDPDADGHHITVLLIIVLQKFADDFLKEGRVSVILTPLYCGKKRKEFIPLYSHSETDYYRKNGYNIIRFKGLGEMSAEQLKATLENGYQYTLEYPENKEEINTLVNIITNTDLKRKVLNNSRCSAENLIKKVIAKSI
ncbi:MAG: toprim domain-containing protein [bacterium]